MFRFLVAFRSHALIHLISTNVSRAIV